MTELVKTCLLEYSSSSTAATSQQSLPNSAQQQSLSSDTLAHFDSKNSTTVAVTISVSHSLKPAASNLPFGHSHSIAVRMLSFHCHLKHDLSPFSNHHQHFQSTVQNIRLIRQFMFVNLLSSCGFHDSVGVLCYYSHKSGNVRKINFCQWCGGPTKHEIPDGEEKLRAICTVCDRIAYQNPKMVRPIIE